jgi:hypothetical protein
MELVVICRSHRRKCYVDPSYTGDGIRIRHTTISSATGELCESQRFLVRHEFEMNRSETYAQMTEWVMASKDLIQ